jgi:membrane-associated protein
VPIVRTFTPVVAGASHMQYGTFLTFNVIGGTLWGCGVTTLGYFLGRIAFVRENIEFILIGIVVVSVVPVAVELLPGRRRSRRAQAEPS